MVDTRARSEYIETQLFNGYTEYVGDLYDPELLAYIS